MRSLLGILLVAALFAGTAHGKDVDKHPGIEVRQAQVGETLILDFKGNKGAAHGWRLVAPDSVGLELVDVSMLGWILSGKSRVSMFSNHDTMRFRVRAKAKGQARRTVHANAFFVQPAVAAQTPASGIAVVMIGPRHLQKGAMPIAGGLDIRQVSRLSAKNLKKGDVLFRR